MVHFLASWGSLDICHRDSGHSAVLLQVAPTDRIRDTTQNTDVRRPKHPCTFLRVFVRRIWVEAWLEICLRPAGSNEARSIMSNVKSVLPFALQPKHFVANGFGAGIGVSIIHMPKWQADSCI